MPCWWCSRVRRRLHGGVSLIGGPNSRGGHPPRDVTWACILLLDVQEHRLAGVPFYYRRTAVDRTLLEP